MAAAAASPGSRDAPTRAASGWRNPGRRGSFEENREHYGALFARNGFTVTQFRDITPNVLEALRGDHDRKAAFLKWVSGTFIYDELREMFACVGSGKYRDFESGA